LLRCLSSISLSYFSRNLCHRTGRCPSGLLLSEYGNIKLVLGILIDVSEVLRDAIFGSEVLLSEIDCLFVAEDGGRVGTQEFLLYSHVVIGDGKDGGTVLRVFVACRKLFLFLLDGMGVKSLPKLHLL
jgi:hypothetical protein